MWWNYKSSNVALAYGIELSDAQYTPSSSVINFGSIIVFIIIKITPLSWKVFRWLRHHTLPDLPQSLEKIIFQAKFAVELQVDFIFLYMVLYVQYIGYAPQVVHRH